MVMNPKLWKVLDNVPDIDDARIEASRQQSETYMESDDEFTQQLGRKMEAAVEKIEILKAEHNQLLRLATNVGRTQHSDFTVNVPGDTLELDQITGGKVKQVTMLILDDAIKINRLEYLTSYLILLKV